MDNMCLPMSACKQIYQSLYCSASVFEVFVGGEWHMKINGLFKI